MSYHFSKIVEKSFNETIDSVVQELKKEGFGVLSNIDVQAALKKHGVDFMQYRILGACNPHFAHQALLAEPHIGTMLPCNVVVREMEDGGVEASAVDPLASMRAVDNPALQKIAAQIREKLQRVIASL
ncbi:hypothetical protein BMS3Bbin14_00462 [bacterium BMS3Bbin14]|nr:hypothetical protein BMS3Abin13_00467 [bacterium BMS3Abin13]GBE52004.1 hypothetical protein BMS3Bbin14_00462 [bacterium BMS3Bbin14]